ncbi:hypothetical protein IMW75_26595 [Pseudomonas gregormendelii]|uniref:Uncharacterized protein n=1 Tax=Pseudomonas gregormendelii TaxID=1628277 RepID=A0ABS3AT82_9PSED|nr:hypothetical protein [Pseudomonas gregormendelii]MBN3968814.1 hypothetical protein [Pseudomonas gregormendelii]
MAIFNSTQVLELLGKTVSVTEVCDGFTSSAEGVVTAVVVALPGADVGPSIMVSGGPEGVFFDLSDSVLTVH